MRTSVKIGIVAVIAIVVVAVAAAAMSGSSSDDEPEIRYNYSVQMTDSFGDGSLWTPDEGCTFAVVTFAFANDSYEEGFSTNPLVFAVDVTVDGLTYGVSSETFGHPGYRLVEIEVGGAATCSYVFKVPEGTDAGDVEVSWEVQWTYDEPTMGLDTSLTVPEY